MPVDRRTKPRGVKYHDRVTRSWYSTPRRGPTRSKSLLCPEQQVKSIWSSAEVRVMRRYKAIAIGKIHVPVRHAMASSPLEPFRHPYVQADSRGTENMVRVEQRLTVQKRPHPALSTRFGFTCRNEPSELYPKSKGMIRTPGPNRLPPTAHALHPNPTRT